LNGETVRGILRPLRPGPKSRFRFAVYDIECPSKEDLSFYSCGFFDGEQYSYFRTMEEFLCYVLKPEYSGFRFFAHFGGRFDVHYVFDWLREHEPNTYMEINCAGSCVISLTVRQGKYYWRFTDSYRLLPKSLETLTIEFEVQHKKLRGLDFKDRIYNEHDCRGLYEVLEQFFDAFEICSETIASHAMRVFRSAFLRRDIYQPNEEIESFVRKAYFGGRCEIYRYDERELNHYDVNSLFPAAMRENVPVEYLHQTRSIPDDDSRIGFYLASVKYPEVYLPILPFRYDKLYFPVGEFSGYFTSMDLRRAIEDGASVNVIAGKLFHAEPIMREYALGLFEMKKKAEEEGKSGKRYISKILMNSLYGKFGQRREQRTFFVDDGRPGAYPLPNGLAWEFTESRAAHILPHISAAITSRARSMQYDLLRRAPNWYTDTDSLFTSGEYETDSGLGALHYEGRGKFQAYRLKEYRFQGEYKVKGLPRSKNDDEEKRKEEDRALAEKYFAGEKILSERMIGFTESIRAGERTVRRVERPRQFRPVLDKRCRIENDSRPWKASELIA
jgi:hypothetical protein